MAINLTIEFTRPQDNDQINRNFEHLVSQWLHEQITARYAHLRPDVHVDFFDAPWIEHQGLSSGPTPSDGSPSA